jgi:hypothetical protein
MTVKEFKSMLDTADELQKISDDLETAYANNPEDDATEIMFDAAYAAYWGHCKNIAEVLVRSTASRITIKTALQMAFHKRSEMRNISVC